MSVPRLGSRGPVPRSIQERVAGHVRVTPTGCHEWTASLGGRGRPHIMTGSTVDCTRRARPVHKALWVEAHGPPPPGYDVHHTCENILCVNLEHLTLLTHGEHSAHHSAAMSPKARSQRARYAQHVRWHVRKGTMKAGCSFCDGPVISG